MDNIIYLDNAATSKVYPEVLESYNQITLKYFANPSLQLEECFYNGEFVKVYHDANAIFKRMHVEESGNANG